MLKNLQSCSSQDGTGSSAKQTAKAHDIALKQPDGVCRTEHPFDNAVLILDNWSEQSTGTLQMSHLSSSMHSYLGTERLRLDTMGGSHSSMESTQIPGHDPLVSTRLPA